MQLQALVDEFPHVQLSDLILVLDVARHIHAKGIPPGEDVKALRAAAARESPWLHLHATDAQLQRIINVVLGAGPRARAAADSIKAALGSVRLGEVVAPVVTHCLFCEGALSKAEPVPRAKPYFYDARGTGARGTAYYRVCVCGA
jgi:hypothetical protein